MLHLPTTVGGNPQGISRHLVELGVVSESFSVYQNYFGYPADKIIANKFDNPLWIELKKLWLLNYVFQYDVIFFNFGRTLFYPLIISNNGKRKYLKLIFSSIYSLYNILMQKVEVFLLKLFKRKLLFNSKVMMLVRATIAPLIFQYQLQTKLVKIITIIFQIL